jgi:hypothetical protein
VFKVVCRPGRGALDNILLAPKPEHKAVVMYALISPAFSFKPAATEIVLSETGHRLGALAELCGLCKENCGGFMWVLT